MERPRHFGTFRESWIEDRLRQALGETDVMSLPGAGQPIPGIDEPYDPLWWGKKVVARERLNVVPPAVEIRRRVELALDEVARMGDEAQVRKRLEDVNREIARTNATTTSGPATSVAPLDVAKLLDLWRQSRRSRS